MKYNMDDLTEEQKSKYTKYKMEEIQNNYENFSKQREERRQVRLEQQRKRIIKTRAAVIITTIAMAAGIYTLEKEVLDSNYEMPDEPTMYEQYVEEVQNLREQGFEVTLSEEGYKAYCEEHQENDNSKGSKNI